MKREFTHLHVHTEYSLLDGFSRIDRLLDRTVELGMDSMAITDHGRMFGVIDFYKKARSRNINPIIGCETYVARRGYRDKDPNLDKYSYHLILLAENNEGYQNLIKLVSESYVEGFYYKPRVDKELLKKYSKGIIALSACMSGEIPRALINRDYDRAKTIAVEYRDIFGEGNFFLELQDHGLPEQKEINAGLVKISRELNIPLVATNDLHYVDKDDARIQDIIMCISTQRTVNETDRMRMPTEEFYLKSPEQMYELFSYVPEALENTRLIAERCNVTFDFNTYHLPEYNPPEGYTKEAYLRELCEKGLEERYGDRINQELRDRLEFEINTIEQMGYVEYFLIVWDFIAYAKNNNIMVGPGRGSAAGSLVAYTLHITDIDPIKYNLIFERFLNPERISMPDIDIDFCYERREEVIDYVKRKYGANHVAQIITFGTMGAKIAIRDVGRVLDIAYNKVDNIAKEIPMELGMTIDKALDKNKVLRDMYESDTQTAEIIDISRKIEGMLRHASTHAAGVVISKKPVDEYVPLYRHQDSITTQFPMTTLEELGLLKMDFLGLRTLTVIRDTLELIELNRERMGYTEVIDLSTMEYDDPKVFEMISMGNTLGVFQLESSGMRNFMKQLKPSNFEDIVAGISLFRPGPMDSIPKYIQNKNNPELVEYTHESLKSILDVTYGCLVYQEQVMQVVRDLAGYSFGRSDLVRRAMSKKKMSVMEEERNYFIHGKYDDKGNIEIEGCIRNGVDEGSANQIFDDMIDFAKYAFNKSHAAAYGVLAYETAYLKYYYPVEFMAALMTSIMGNSDKVVEYIRECNSMGIEVVPPNINKSMSKFSVDGDKIRFGLAAIKNVGLSLIDNVIEERNRDGEFKNLEDYINRMTGKDLNKKAVESMIKAGVFDNLGFNRSTMLSEFENIITSVNKDRKRNVAGQISLFDIAEDDEDLLQGAMLKEIPEYPEKLILEMEKGVLGLYISGHPLSEYEEKLKNTTSMNIGRINELRDDHTKFMSLNNQEVIMGGMIIYKRVTTTKKDQLMAFVQIEDLYGSIEAVIFPKLYDECSQLLKDYEIVQIRGKLSIREDEEISIIADDIKRIDDERELKGSGFGQRAAVNNERESSDNSQDFVSAGFEPIEEYQPKKIFLRIDSMKNDELIRDIIICANGLLGEDRIILCPKDEHKKAYEMKELKVYHCRILEDRLKEILADEDIRVMEAK